MTTNDLRRMVPFRRRNEGRNVTQLEGEGGVLDVGLLEWFLGADQMAEPFAIQAGNTRAYEKPNTRRVPPENIHEARPWAWAIASDGSVATMEALSDYRLPPSIHDLFVNDLHRRFFQRLHRTVQEEVELTGRNADNMEIYAGSPSYLITAGGSPGPWAIDPGPAGFISPEKIAQQLGVAVTTSFMPTAEYIHGAAQYAGDLIQFSSTSDTPGQVANYGVAPDFACGYKVYLPPSIPRINDQEFQFIDRRYYGNDDIPGYYLAIYKDGDFGLLEAFDSWLHPEVSFDQFKTSVLDKNANLRLLNNVETLYTTQNGNRLRFVIWNYTGLFPIQEIYGATYGAKILQIDYGDGDRKDTLVDAGNDTGKFLSGTIMNNPQEGVVEITNPSSARKSSWT